MSVAPGYVTTERCIPWLQDPRRDIGAFEWEAPAAIEVNIDVKPGSFANPINLTSRGITL